MSVFSISGIAEVMSNMKRYEAKLETAIESALNDIGADLQRRSQERAPIDTGDLRGSASFKLRKMTGTFRLVVGFGTIYAMKQHENLEYKHPQGGEAKYLERPFFENQRKYVQLIKNRVEMIK